MGTIRISGCFLPIAAGAFLAFAAFPAIAADDCANASDQATLNECADKSYKASDRQLNELYGEIKQRVANDADRTRLWVAGQKAWLAFRDAECKFSSSGVEGGSAYPMILTICLDSLTQSRIEDFTAYLACEEGDLSCPVPHS